MTTSLHIRTRIEQSKREFDFLRAEINAWLSGVEKKDKLRKYVTQLKVLGELLDRAIVKLKGDFQRVTNSQNSGAVYAMCRQFDGRALWLRRLWLYFRTKFDQREDNRFESVLAAADEIVWSCYAQAFEESSPSEMLGAPLAYIDSSYSPQAVPRSDPPQDLRGKEGEFFQDCLAQMPLPVVGVPLACVNNPWWLIFLGHEVGHQVQHDFAPGWGLVIQFGELLKTVAENEPEPRCSEENAARWKSWGQEIFADVFSIYAMGNWALWALTEWERTDQVSMLKERRGARSAYPSPVVRLALSARIAKGINGGGEVARPDIGLPEATPDPSHPTQAFDLLRCAADADLKVIGKIAAAIPGLILSPSVNFGKLFASTEKDFGVYGSVYRWTEAFLGRAPLLAEKKLSAARLAISGAVGAWAEIIEIDNEQEREEKREQLRMNILNIIPKSRDERTRAAIAPAKDTMEHRAERLAQLLIERGTDEDASLV